jgi:hypothetical protein
MKEESKFIKAIAKLIQLTQDGDLKWSINKNTKQITEGTNNIIDVVYTAHEENEHLRLYEMKFKNWLEEDTFEWDNQAFLEIIDELGNAIWTFPSNRTLWDLLEAVRYQTSGVDDFINRLLSKAKK